MANKISDETIEYVGILAKLELSDEDAPDFDGYLFESVPLFQGKLV